MAGTAEPAEGGPMWEALAVGPMPEQLASRAHGEARLSLYLDGQADAIELSAQASWWTPDGDMRESSLQLQGDTSEAYALLDEASRWIWARWKRPYREAAGPFG